MADLAAIHDLTYDATSVQQSPIGIHLEITRGINEIPVTRGEDDTVASRAGRSSYPRLADVLPLELGGAVIGIGDTVEEQQESFRTLMLALRTLLAGGSLTPKVLAGTLEDGSGAAINARAVDLQVDVMVESIAAEVRVALESVDPDWVITPAGP